MLDAPKLPQVWWNIFKNCFGENFMKLFIILSFGLFSALAIADIKLVDSLDDKNLYSLQESFDFSESFKKSKTAVEICLGLTNDPAQVLGRMQETCVSENKIFSNAGINACEYRESKLAIALNFICIDRPEEYKNMDCQSLASCKYETEMSQFKTNTLALDDWSRNITSRLTEALNYEHEKLNVACKNVLKLKQVDYSKDFKVPSEVPMTCQYAINYKLPEMKVVEEQEPKLTKREQACNAVGFSRFYESEDLNNCLKTNIETDLIIACTKAMKTSSSISTANNILGCYTSKQSIAKISLCANVGFPYADQVQTCYKTPVATEVIQACKESGIKNAGVFQSCIELNKPVSKIRDCSIKSDDPYDNNDVKILKCETIIECVGRASLVQIRPNNNALKIVKPIKQVMLNSTICQMLGSSTKLLMPNLPIIWKIVAAVKQEISKIISNLSLPPLELGRL